MRRNDQSITLTRVADGSASERDRARAEAYVACSPDAERRLDRQALVVTLARAGGPELSEDVRRSLAADGRRRRGTAPRSARLGPALAVACGVVVALAGVSAWRLADTAGPHTPLTVTQLARLALGSATAPPPRRNPNDGVVLQARLGGVTFPDYEHQLHARASGQRRDLLGTRTVETVYYMLRSGARLSYSVVSGPSLPLPPPVRELAVAGVRLRVYHEHGLNAVVLVRHGRTCVLAGSVPSATIVTLAAAPLLQPSRA
jgi:hypothetical protein